MLPDIPVMQGGGSEGDVPNGKPLLRTTPVECTMTLGNIVLNTERDDPVIIKVN